MFFILACLWCLKVTAFPSSKPQYVREAAKTGRGHELNEVKAAAVFWKSHKEGTAHASSEF